MADITNVRLLPGVGPHVLGQLVGLAKRFLTDAAHVRAFPGVGADVRYQVGTGGKGAGAQVALVGPLS